MEVFTDQGTGATGLMTNATIAATGGGTPDTAPPTSPTNLAATSPSQSSISVSWTASTDPTVAGQTTSGVTGYHIERCQGSGCSNFTQVGTPTASPFVDSGLTANTFYNYHVRATDAAGNLSGWSNVVGATTQSSLINYFTWGAESNSFTASNISGNSFLSYKGATTRDCTVSHTGSCSMKLAVIGNDGGNNQMGAELPDWNRLPVNVVGGPAIYYRWWMRIMPDFSWGSGTAKTKSSRIIGTAYPRVMTGYVQADGFNIGECDDVGSSQPGGGCVDPGPTISYDMRAKNDGLWHEYIVKMKPNTTTTATDAQFQVWVDGVSIGANNNWLLHNKNGNGWNEAWAGWMLYPYFQLNGTSSDGGTMYIDDISTDNAWNSIYSGGTPAPTFTLSANPTSITSGQSSTLTWSAVANATSCTASGGTFTGSKSISGGTQSVSPTSTATYTLSCTGAGGTTDRSATVTVGTGGGSECPSNWKAVHPSWIWCDDFETDKSSLHVDHNGWGTSLVRSSGNGYNGTTSLRSTFPAAPGSVSNGGDFMVSFGASPVTPKIDPADNTKYQELYWRAFIKTQPGWQPGTGMKFTRATSFAASDWSQAMITHWWGGGNPENFLSVDPASGVCRGGVYPAGSPACTNNTVITNGWNDFNGLYWLGLNTGTNNIMGSASANTWRCVEGYVKLNTSGNSDGVQTLWIDGTQDANRTGLNFVGTYSAYGLNVFRLENYMNQGVSQSEYRDWDNLVLSTTRVGCSVSGGGDTASPTSPTGLAANAMSSSSITVSWTASTDDVGVTGYIVERCQGSGCSNFTQVGTPTASPFIDTGLTPNTVYNYHVRATDAASNLSGWSNVVGATTQGGTSSPASYVQGASNTADGDATTITQSFSSNTTAGGSLVAAVSWGSNATLSCSDSRGNTYQVATSAYDASNNQSLAICYALNIQGGATTVTATFSAASGYRRLLIHEYGTLSGIDVTKTNIADGTTVTNGITSTSVTTTQNGDLIFGAVMDDAGTTGITAGTNFTQRQSVNNKDLASQDMIQTSSGSIASTQTFGTAHRYLAQMVAFKVPVQASASCNTVTTSNFSQSAYNSYGAPFDAFQTSTNLIDAKCNSTDTHTVNLTTGITGDTTRIVYTKGYWYDAVTTAWRQYTGTCAGALNGEWCQGSVSATITDANVSTASSTTPTYLVGMTCSVQGGSWKCGCRDTTCSNFSWQIQGAGL